MYKSLRALFGALLVTIIVIAASPQIAAGSTVSLLGFQDFSDGQTPIFASEMGLAGAGEPFPFDGTLFGNDNIDDSLGSFSYTHTFDLSGEAPTSAELTIGLIDHDSFDANFPADTIDFFFDGVQQPDAIFKGISLRPSSVSVVSVPVPLNFILDGELVVHFAATKPGISNDGNGIAPDFSELEIQTVPEPTTLVMFAFGAFVVMRKALLRS
ncbi:MAG: hypothetical protein DHS20C16_29540 [Phycisphaerae bacterium]|nr:MAG: hypothetical protein DHS20C16_29540 [Phycisphaerae bacterium]